MAIVPLPSGARIRTTAWSLDRPAQVNSFPYTGGRAVVANPWHGKWSCKAELAPIVGETNVRSWRAFLAKLRGTVNTFLLPAVESAQMTLGSSQATVANKVNTTVTALGGGLYRVTKTGGVNGTLDAQAVTSTAMNGDFTIAFKINTPGTVGVRLGLAASATPAIGAVLFGINTDASNLYAEEASNSTKTIGAIGTGWWFLCRRGNLVTLRSGPTQFVTDSTLVWEYSADYSGTHFFDSELANTNAQFDVIVTYDTAQVTASGSASVGATAVSCTGLPQQFVPGMLATIWLPSGNKQLVLVKSVTSFGSTLNFEPQLREAISAGAIIEVVRPYAQMALDGTTLGWLADVGQNYHIAFDVEEAYR